MSVRMERSADMNTISANTSGTGKEKISPPLEVFVPSGKRTGGATSAGNAGS